MLQPVNDCYWSPKPRRDDVPRTSAPRHVTLPELKYCEVPDSVLSFVSTLHYASLHLAVLCRAIRATLHSSRYSALLRATPRYSALHCATPRYSALLYATLRFSTLRCASLRYAALLYATQRFSMLLCASLRYTALLYATLRSPTIHCALPRYPHSTALLCTKLRSYDATLYCASTITRYIALLRYTALHCAPLRCCATLPITICCATPRHATLPCATPCNTALLCTILGYSALFSTLFYSINCKLTTGLMDVETDEGCDDTAPYSK